MSRRGNDWVRKVWDLDGSVGSTGRALCAVAAVLVSLLVATAADPIGVRAVIGLVTVLVAYPLFLALARLTIQRFR